MIVVTGATGNVGRPLVAAQVSAGARVTAVSRTPAAVPGGAVHRVADLAAPDSLRPVLEGTEALFLFPGGPSPAELVSVAEGAGVRRIVLLSSQGAATRPEAYAFSTAYEEAVRSSRLPATILRPGGFATNTLAWVPAIRASRTAAAPFADVALPVVDPADVASVAAAAVLDDSHTGALYTVTGPQALTPRDRAAALGAALGEPIGFVEQPPAQARAQLLELMPAPIADATLAVLGAPLPEEQKVSPDAELVLGRPPRTFAEWAADSVEAFR
ncbi:SDR family oxidoreductase [Amycolatopsis sp. FDAARGOS 1241]|uniref:SDR family oxidoreductase n=1 Tax=Amycolatopsis sp. FDAARGOS 1241 TaxID=2778070 RepID=UPI001952900E|nr:NAD(P)H-binding protein [Amycolatopsis sp. FDAARGOS 1241]QRP49328.1 NAD(P)H-binding protein [Amycolatopsis sp. FDAARGOS 1241]